MFFYVQAIVIDVWALRRIQQTYSHKWGITAFCYNIPLHWGIIILKMLKHIWGVQGSEPLRWLFALGISNWFLARPSLLLKQPFPWVTWVPRSSSTSLKSGLWFSFVKYVSLIWVGKSRRDIEIQICKLFACSKGIVARTINWKSCRF